MFEPQMTWVNSSSPWEIPEAATAPANLDAVALAAIFASILISNVVYALTGFGNAILLHVFWQILFLMLGRAETSDDLVQVVVLNFIMSVVSVFPLLAITRRDIHWQPVIWVGIPCFLGTALGTHLLFSTDPALAKRILGLVFLCFAAWKLCAEIITLDIVKRSSWMQPGTALYRVARTLFPSSWNSDSSADSTSSAPEPHENLSVSSLSWWISTQWGPPMPLGSKIASLVAGFASGLLRGMFGAGGPPLMIYVTVIQMDKVQVRALSNTLGVLMTPLSLGLLLSSGGFSADRWPSYGITVIGSILGLFIGAKMFSWFDNAAIMRGILLLLALASVVMLSPPIGITVFVFVVCIGIVVGFVIFKIRSSRLRAEPPSHLLVASDTNDVNSVDSEAQEVRRATGNLSEDEEAIL